MPMFAPCSAAPVSSKPRIGPAQGAQSNPVATPSNTDAPGLDRPSLLAPCDRRLPAATNGRVRRSARLGSISVRPNSATSSKASQRPYWLSCTTQLPPTAANVATRVNVSAIPASSGPLLRQNGSPVRANTKGNTGRMQGLTMVSTPPR
ncbi:hypothetical protein D9M71_347580 [compost metagenome]